MCGLMLLVDNMTMHEKAYNLDKRDHQSKFKQCKWFSSKQMVVCKLGQPDMKQLQYSNPIS